MPAFWILPLDVLIRAADSAAPAFMAAFVAYLHPLAFPFVDLGRAKYSAELIRAFSRANIVIKYG